MNELISSYEYHRRIESPLSFVRREWIALALFAGAFVTVMLVVIMALEPAFFYPRLSSDPLLYYMKGMSFAATGRADALLAVNIPPVHYVSMPGILRAPAFWMFDGFDARLRAMQVANVFLVALTAAIYSYILSWAVSRSWHWVAIGFTYSFFLLSPWWITNVLAPLGDAPYAAFTALFCIAAVRITTSNSPIVRHRVAAGAALLLFGLAFLVRFTAPAVLVFAATLGLGRALAHGASIKRFVLATIIAAVVIVLMIALNWEVLSRRYLGEALLFLSKGDVPSMLVNLFAVAIPAQVLPIFQLGFSNPPVNSIFTVRIMPTLRDYAWAAFGVVISALVLTGMWRSRKNLLPEVLYVLAPLPALVLIIPSTSRYLMSYQPFIWMFIVAALAFAFAPLTSRVRNAGALIAVAMAIVAAIGMTVLRAKRMSGTEARSSLSVSIATAPAYVNDVAVTFRKLRGFLESLPRDRTLLIGGRGTVGRWSAISDIDYYYPDSALAATVAKRDVYLVHECGTRDYCLVDSKWLSIAQAPVDEYGKFSYELVFNHETKHARAAVYRMRLVN